MSKPTNNLPAPIPANDGGYHRMTVRMNNQYHAYLEHLSFKTGLDMVQLVRLLIHLAPQNEEFKRIIDGYIRADRRGILYVTDWRDKDFMWKRL